MLDSVKLKQTEASHKASAAKERRIEQEEEARIKLDSHRQKLEAAEERRNKLLEEKKNKISEDKIQAEQKRKIQREIRNSPQKEIESEDSSEEWESETSGDETIKPPNRKRASTLSAEELHENRKYKTCFTFNRKNIRNKYIGTKNRFTKIAKEKKIKLRWCPH